MLEVTESTGWPSRSSAIATWPSAAPPTQNSSRNRARRSAAHSTSAGHRVLAERLEQGRATDRRVVGVGLHLAERDRRLGQPAVGELHGVVAVLPALVGQAGARSGRRTAASRSRRTAPSARPGSRARRAAGRAPGPGRRPRRGRRRGCRRTAGWRRRCRSRAAGGSSRRPPARVRTSCRILPGCSSVAGSSRVPCRRASTRSVESASPVSNGTSIRAAHNESRPKRVRNHGLPAARNRSSPSASSSPPRSARLCSAVRRSRMSADSTVADQGAGRPGPNEPMVPLVARTETSRRSPRASRNRQVSRPVAASTSGAGSAAISTSPSAHRRPAGGRLRGPPDRRRRPA